MRAEHDRGLVPRAHRLDAAHLARLVEGWLRVGRPLEAVERVVGHWVREHGGGPRDLPALFATLGLDRSTRTLTRVDGHARRPDAGPSATEPSFVWPSALLRDGAWFHHLRQEAASARVTSQVAHAVAPPQSVAPLPPGVYALQRDAIDALPPGLDLDIADILRRLGPGCALSADAAARVAVRVPALDVSGVRVHRGAEADRLCRELRAEAFALGHHIVVASRWDLQSDGGTALLVHELTHVWQQARGLVPRPARGVVVDDPALERAADLPLSPADEPRPEAAIAPRAEPVAVQREPLRPRPVRVPRLQRHPTPTPTRPPPLPRPGATAPRPQPGAQLERALPAAFEPVVPPGEDVPAIVAVVVRMMRAPRAPTVSRIVVAYEQLAFYDVRGHPERAFGPLTTAFGFEPGLYIVAAERVDRLWANYADEPVPLADGRVVPPQDVVPILDMAGVHFVPTMPSVPADVMAALATPPFVFVVTRRWQDAATHEASPSPGTRGALGDLEEGQGVANLPAYPATLEGPESMPVGATSHFTMALDWTLMGIQDARAAAFDAMRRREVSYIWQVWGVTADADAGHSLDGESLSRMRRRYGDNIAREIRRGRGRQGRRVSDWDAAVHRISRQHAEDHDDLQRLSRTPGVLASAAQLAATGAILPRRLYDGIAMVAGYDDERFVRELHFDTDGVYIVRCIAQPRPMGDERRAASVRTKVVVVAHADAIADEALDDEEARARAARQALAAEPDPVLQAAAEAAQRAFDQSANGSPAAALAAALSDLEQAIRDIDRELASRPHGVFNLGLVRRKAELQEQRSELYDQYTRAIEQEREIVAMSDGRVRHRPIVVFVDRNTGSRLPLLVMLGLAVPQIGHARALVTDVTTGDFQRAMGFGATPQAAVWAAFEELAGRLDYGRGSLGVQLPESVTSAHQIPRAAARHVFSVEPRDAALVAVAVQKAMRTLTLVGAMVPIVGGAAGVLGAAVSIRNIERRIGDMRSGLLPLTLDWQVLNDVLNVVGPGLSLLQRISAARQGGANFWGASAHAAAWERVGRLLEHVDRGIDVGQSATDISNALATMAAITARERRGELNPAEARGQRLEQLAGLADIMLPRLVAQAVHGPPPEHGTLPGPVPTSHPPAQGTPQHQPPTLTPSQPGASTPTAGTGLAPVTNTPSTHPGRDPFGVPTTHAPAVEPPLPRIASPTDAASVRGLYDWLLQRTGAVDQARQRTTAATREHRRMRADERVQADAPDAVALLRLWFQAGSWQDAMIPLTQALAAEHARRPDTARLTVSPSELVAAGRDWLHARVLDRVARRARAQGWAFDPARDTVRPGSSGSSSDLDPTIGGEHTLRAHAAYADEMMQELRALGIPQPETWHEVLGMNPYTDPSAELFWVRGEPREMRRRQRDLVENEMALIESRTFEHRAHEGPSGLAQWAVYVDEQARSASSRARQAALGRGEPPDVMEARAREAEGRVRQLMAHAQGIAEYRDTQLVTAAEALRRSPPAALRDVLRDMPTGRHELLAWLRSPEARRVRAEAVTRLHAEARDMLQRTIDAYGGRAAGPRMNDIQRVTILQLINRMKMFEEDAYLLSAHRSVVEHQQTRTQNRIEAGEHPVGGADIELAPIRRLASLTEQLQRLDHHDGEFFENPSLWLKNTVKYLSRAIWEAELLGSPLSPEIHDLYDLCRLIRTRRVGEPGQQLGERVGEDRVTMTRDEADRIIAAARARGFIDPATGVEALRTTHVTVGLTQFRQAYHGAIGELRAAKVEALTMPELELEARARAHQAARERTPTEPRPIGAEPPAPSSRPRRLAPPEAGDAEVPEPAPATGAEALHIGRQTAVAALAGEQPCFATHDANRYMAMWWQTQGHTRGEIPTPAFRDASGRVVVLTDGREPVSAATRLQPSEELLAQARQRIEAPEPPTPAGVFAEVGSAPGSLVTVEQGIRAVTEGGGDLRRVIVERDPDAYATEFWLTVGAADVPVPASGFRGRDGALHVLLPEGSSRPNPGTYVPLDPVRRRAEQALAAAPRGPSREHESPALTHPILSRSLPRGEARPRTPDEALASLPPEVARRLIAGRMPDAAHVLFRAPEAAFAAYRALIELDPARWVGIYANATGDGFVVVQGSSSDARLSMSAVGAVLGREGRAGEWRSARRYAPIFEDPGHHVLGGPVADDPSASALDALLAHVPTSRRPTRERLDFWTSAGFGWAELGYDGHGAMPYWVHWHVPDRGARGTTLSEESARMPTPEAFVGAVRERFHALRREVGADAPEVQRAPGAASPAPAPAPSETPGRVLGQHELSSLLQRHARDVTRVWYESDPDSYARAFMQARGTTLVGPELPAFVATGGVVVVFRNADGSIPGPGPVTYDYARVQAEMASYLANRGRGRHGREQVVGVDQGVGLEPGTPITPSQARAILRGERHRGQHPEETSVYPGQAGVVVRQDFALFLREYLLSAGNADAPLPGAGFRRSDGAIVVFEPATARFGRARGGTESQVAQLRNEVRDALHRDPLNALAPTVPASASAAIRRDLQPRGASARPRTRAELLQALRSAPRGRAFLSSLASGRVLEDAAVEFHNLNEALGVYQTLIELDPSREVALVAGGVGLLQTFLVVQGGPSAVNPYLAARQAGIASWIGGGQSRHVVRHYHPVRELAGGRSPRDFPSIDLGLGSGDIEALIWRATYGAPPPGGSPELVERIDVWTEAGWGTASYAYDTRPGVSHPLVLRWRIPGVDGVDSGERRFRDAAEYTLYLATWMDARVLSRR